MIEIIYSETSETESPIEEIFWNEVKERLPDLEVIPQKVIGKYRVDFFIPKGRLIIECDGSAYHKDREKDFRRDMDLENQGYRVIRFTGKRIHKELVRRDMEGNMGLYDIIDIIRFYADDSKRRW
jgi:very-short-patch-repair endonuclease